MPRGGYKEGGGRPKGSPNKIGSQVREAILEAFKQAGGASYLHRLSQEHPQVFAVLLGKILPTEIEHSGEVALSHADDDVKVLLRFMEAQSAQAKTTPETLQ